MSSTRFTILSYNVRGIMSATRQNELTLYITRHTPSLIILQEPMYHHLDTHTRADGTTEKKEQRKEPRFMDYISYHFPHHSKNTGILMYAHKYTKLNPLDIPRSAVYVADPNSTSVVAFAQISHPLLALPIVVGGVYLHAGGQEVDIQTLARYAAAAAIPPFSPSSPPRPSPANLRPLFLVGDFNARHTAWDEKATTSNARGVWVHKHLIGPKAVQRTPTLPLLKLANIAFKASKFAPTHHNDDTHDTVIDLALSSHVPMMLNMQVVTDVVGSDHYPLLLTFKAPTALVKAHALTLKPKKQRALVPRAQHNTHPTRSRSRAIQVRNAQRTTEQSQEQEQEGRDYNNDEKGEVTSHTMRTRRQTAAAAALAFPPIPSDPAYKLPPNLRAPVTPAPEKFPSRGRGLGLRASTHYKFRARSVIGYYTGKITTEAEKQALYPLNDAKYLIKCKHDMYIDAVDPTRSSDMRYINTRNKDADSKERHNVRAQVSFVDGVPVVTIRAMCDIRPGVELLMAYSNGYHIEESELAEGKASEQNTDDSEEHAQEGSADEQNEGAPAQEQEQDERDHDNDADAHTAAADEQISEAEGQSEITDEQVLAQAMDAVDGEIGAAAQPAAPPHPDHVLVPPRPLPRSYALHATLFTDGASRQNPGPTSCGGVISWDRDAAYPGVRHKDLPPSVQRFHLPLVEFGRFLGRNTNNFAEYQGLLHGLQQAKDFGITHLKVYMDSNLIVKHMNGAWRVKSPYLEETYDKCRALSYAFESCSFQHVYRDMNKDADRLCNDVLNNEEENRYPYDIHRVADPAQVPRECYVQRDVDAHDADVSDTQPQTSVQEMDERVLMANMQERLKWRVNNPQKPVDWKLYEDTVTAALAPWSAKYTAWAEEGALQLQRKDVEDCWLAILDIMVTAADKVVGVAKVAPGSKQWWAMVYGMDGLYNAYRHAKNVMRKNMKRSRGVQPHIKAQDKHYYKKAKSEFNKAVREAKQKSWNELIATVDAKTPDHRHKLLWAASKRLMKQQAAAKGSFCDEHGIPPETEAQSLDNMATHLSRVSSHATSAPSPMEETVQEYLTNVPARPVPSSRVPFSLSQVKGALCSLRLNTSLGSDNVSPHFLKFGGDPLHRAMNMLFKICYRHGIMPESWRHGHVVTLYKGEGDVNDPGSYRPITITSVVARAYERVNSHELLAAMLDKDIPGLDQFGFTKGRSTHDALYRLLARIETTIAAGTWRNKFAPAVFVDISKAYDKVWIEGLLYKLHKECGITGNLYHMLKELIMNRTIQVVQDGKMSIRLVLTAGVPQGSILAPFLFLIYIHDMLTPEQTKELQLMSSLFADDIAVMSRLPGMPGMQCLQRGLNRMTQYAKIWKITFSAKKTNVVMFRKHETPHTVVAPTRTGTLKLGGFLVAKAPQYTYLGVILDEHLTFVPHMRDLHARTQRTVYLITRLVRRDHLPSIPVIRTLVKSVLIPKLFYSLPFVPDAIAERIQTTREVTKERKEQIQLADARRKRKRAVPTAAVASRTNNDNNTQSNTQHNSIQPSDTMLSDAQMLEGADAEQTHMQLTDTEHDDAARSDEQLSDTEQDTYTASRPRGRRATAEEMESKYDADDEQNTSTTRRPGRRARAAPVAPPAGPPTAPMQLAAGTGRPQPQERARPVPVALPIDPPAVPIQLAADAGAPQAQPAPTAPVRTYQGRRQNKYTKNLILRPLLRGMGLPHNTHHDSVFMENRILTMPMLLAVSKAAMVHRWLTIDRDNEGANLAANVFVTNTKGFRSLRDKTPHHPCVQLLTSISKVASFGVDINQPAVDMSKLLALPRHTLKTEAWTQQHAAWKLCTTNTLPKLYGAAPVSMKDIPSYMQYDKPMASARRSRLRYGRARLNFLKHRLGFKDVQPLCTNCTRGRSESVRHVLSGCPLYRDLRKELFLSLCRLHVSFQARDFIKKNKRTLHHIILNPECVPRVGVRNLRRIHRRTAKFINRVYCRRPGNY
jgi:ribonuclease HI/exonuclease III